MNVSVTFTTIEWVIYNVSFVFDLLTFRYTIFSPLRWRCPIEWNIKLSLNRKELVIFPIDDCIVFVSVSIQFNIFSSNVCKIPFHECFYLFSFHTHFHRWTISMLVYFIIAEKMWCTQLQHVWPIDRDRYANRIQWKSTILNRKWMDLNGEFPVERELNEANKLFIICVI